MTKPKGLPKYISIEDQPTLLHLHQRYIDLILEFTEGNKSQAARILGVNVKTVYNYVEGRAKYPIVKPRSKNAAHHRNENVHSRLQDLEKSMQRVLALLEQKRSTDDSPAPQPKTNKLLAVYRKVQEFQEAGMTHDEIANSLGIRIDIANFEAWKKENPLPYKNPFKK